MNKSLSQFKKGDIVQVIDDDVEGEVVSIDNDSIVLTTRDGVTLRYQSHEIILKQQLLVEFIPTHLVKANTSIKSKPKKKNNSFDKDIVIDLHIHQLIENESGMDAFDKLTLQLNTVKDKIQWARDNNISKLIFIHGIGKGVLRKELEYLLKGYPNLTFYDASYQDYGRGAIEVYLYQNSKNQG